MGEWASALLGCDGECGGRRQRVEQPLWAAAGSHRRHDGEVGSGEAAAQPEPSRRFDQNRTHSVQGKQPPAVCCEGVKCNPRRHWQRHKPLSSHEQRRPRVSRTCRPFSGPTVVHLHVSGSISLNIGGHFGGVFAVQQPPPCGVLGCFWVCTAIYFNLAKCRPLGPRRFSRAVGGDSRRRPLPPTVEVHACWVFRCCQPPLTAAQLFESLGVLSVPLSPLHLSPHTTQLTTRNTTYDTHHLLTICRAHVRLRTPRAVWNDGAD